MLGQGFGIIMQIEGFHYQINTNSKSLHFLNLRLQDRVRDTTFLVDYKRAVLDF